MMAFLKVWYLGTLVCILYKVKRKPQANCSTYVLGKIKTFEFPAKAPPKKLPLLEAVTHLSTLP